MRQTEMIYHTPPAEWMEGLPIGNGRIAAMVWGESGYDRLTLNHEWLWKGQHRDRRCEDNAAHLPEVRACIERADWQEAAELANRYFGGGGGVTGKPNDVDPYQPAGELWFRPDGDVQFESRSLELETGLVTVCRTADGRKVKGEFFADCAGGQILCRWTGDGTFSGTLSLNREPEKDAELTIRTEPGFLRLDGAIKGGISFATEVFTDTDGVVTPAGEGVLRIENATFLTAWCGLATSIRGVEKELETFRGRAEFSAALALHEKKFRSCMGRLRLELSESAQNLETMTTDERVRRVKEGQTDNGLCQLYFDYGRYLLLSSSICGELPANLQGKWNDLMDPPWQSDYHFNINLQMNYWMAEPAALPECMEALTRYVLSFLESGQDAAMRLYGCRGVYLPLQTDAWGISTPEAKGSAVWIGAAAWISRSLWEHWIYSGDVDYLRRVYPFFRETARFYEDYLVRDEQGTYQILPSQSPENRIAGLEKYPIYIGKSSAMDVQLCFDALGYTAEAAKVLGEDAEQIPVWEEIRQNLPPFAIGSDGRLLEWDRELPEAEPGHRHLSHLYGIYPSDLFTPNTRREQYEAGIRSLEYRLSHGGGHTGWSRAWVACLEARLGNPADFYEHFTALIKDFATVSLLDLHPPRIFQIDGNLGAVAAGIEALVSFYDGTAHLLSGLPAQWESGSLGGVRIPGGHSLSLAWENGQLTSLKVVIGFGKTAQLAWKGGRQTVSGQPGETVQVL